MQVAAAARVVVAAAADVVLEPPAMGAPAERLRRRPHHQPVAAVVRMVTMLPAGAVVAVDVVAGGRGRSRCLWRQIPSRAAAGGTRHTCRWVWGS